MSINKYFRNDWNVICDLCGRKRKRSECEQSYGPGMEAVFITCSDGCSDSYHPLNDPPPVIFDGYPIPDSRPDVTENNNYTFQPKSGLDPSNMSWGHFVNAGVWGTLNGINSKYDLNGQWLWGRFKKT